MVARCWISCGSWRDQGPGLVVGRRSHRTAPPGVHRQPAQHNVEHRPDVVEEQSAQGPAFDPCRDVSVRWLIAHVRPTSWDSRRQSSLLHDPDAGHRAAAICAAIPGQPTADHHVTIACPTSTMPMWRVRIRSTVQRQVAGGVVVGVRARQPGGEEDVADDRVLLPPPPTGDDVVEPGRRRGTGGDDPSSRRAAHRLADLDRRQVAAAGLSPGAHLARRWPGTSLRRSASRGRAREPARPPARRRPR